MKPDQVKRFKELKRDRAKWWKKVPRSSDHGYSRKFEPVRKGDKPTPAFCIMRDGSVIAVKVWVDDHNYKAVEPHKGTASGRVWPTLEGAYLAQLDKAFKEQEKLLSSLADINSSIKAHEKALRSLGRG